MAENRDSELIDGGSLAVEVSLSDPSPETVHSPESPDGFVHVESSRDGIDGDLGGSDNQGLGSSGGDEDDDDDMRVSEDAGKEEMFVDCPDELVGNVDIRDAIVAAETGESFDEKVQFQVENRGLVGSLASDKVEREALSREISSLRNQLKGLLGENFGQEETFTGVDLNEAVSECSRMVISAREERSRNEAVISELQANVLLKNQEIEELNAKVSGFAASDIEMVTDRLLAYYSGVIDPQELVDYSIAGKLVFVERGTYMLAERYNMMLYEIDLLRQSFSEAGTDLGSQDLGTFFTAARGEVLELKRKEFEFGEKIRQLEGENKKLVQQFDDQTQVVERIKSEISKTKAELEQETIRCGNVKEKLTMAVTKGKALVQQRDSLKQALAEKTAELEKCMLELTEKSKALETAESHKEELQKTESLVASLQETLFQSNAAVEKFEEMLSDSGIPEQLLSMDVFQRCRWLVDEFSELRGLSVEFRKVKDAMSLIQLPESVSSTALESQVHWVIESLNQVKAEHNTLQEEFAMTQKEIYNLTASLSAESQAKGNLQTKLGQLEFKYGEIVEKEHQLSLEKDRIVKTLLEASGFATDDEEIFQSSSDIATLIVRCLGKIKEQSSASLGSSYVNAELFEKVLSYLYVRNQELTLCELVLEEEMPIRSQLDSLSHDLRALSQELAAVKEEKELMQKKLERTEEKSALVREKLTMAVKKGKGLVQDRENLKLQLDEKNSEIENLVNQLQQKESELAEHKDRIFGLSAEAEHISSLEMDVASVKQQRDQLETFLSESNNTLQRVIGYIDGIVLPVDIVFEEPVEKINWLAEYIIECQDAKDLLDKQLAVARDKVAALSGKLEEAETRIQSFEESLSEAETEISRLAEEKTEIEISKDNVERELHKVREEASLHSGRFAEVSETRRSLEEALSLAENNMIAIVSERESALAGRAAMESELELVKEEVASQTTKLIEAYNTIKSLEDGLSMVQSNVDLLTEQNKDSEAQRINLETEHEKFQEEIESQASRLADASQTIESLEGALLKAENNVSALAGEKKVAEEEIATLNLKLNAYVEESAGSNRTLENRSAELSGYLFDLQALMNDNTLLSMLKSFEAKFDSLRYMDNILEHIRDDFRGLGIEELQGSHIMEEDLQAAKSISKCLGNIFCIEKFNIDVSTEDGDHISAFGKVVEGFQLRNKAVADKLDRFSSFVDEFIAALLRKIQATRDEVVIVFKHIESLKHSVNSLEVYKQEQDGTIALKESDITALLSACTDATRELQFEAKNSLMELEQLSIDEVSSQKDSQSDKSSRYSEEIDMLLLASRKVKALCKQFESSANVAASTILEFQNSLKEARTTLDKVSEESYRKQEMISKLEADVEELQNSCSELELIRKDYQDMEVMLKERNVEVEALKISCLEFRALTEEYQGMEAKLKERQVEVEALNSSCSELTALTEEYQDMEAKLKEREAEVEALKNSHSELKALTEEYRDRDIKLKSAEAEVQALQHSNRELEVLQESYRAIQVKFSEKEAEVQALQNSCNKLKLISENYQAMEENLRGKEADVEALKHACSELRLTVEEYQAKEAKLIEKEAEVEALQHTCIELRRLLEEHQANEVRLKEREAEVSSLHNSLLTREQATEDSLLSAPQIKAIFDKVEEIDIHQAEFEEAGDSESQNSAHIKRLLYIVNNFSSLQHHINLITGEKEKLESTLGAQSLEIQLLKEEVENLARENHATEIMKSEQSQVILSLEKILDMLGDNSSNSSSSLVRDQISSGVKGPLSVLEKSVVSLLMECESSKSKAQDLGNKLVGSQKFAEELLAKVKLLEDSLQAKPSQSEIRQERSNFEGPSVPTDPEISEIEDVAKNNKSPPPLVAQMRTMRKGSTDHLAIDIESESSRLINNEETDEDKGHVFKSLNTSGIVPKQGKMVADRLDGMWVSGGRILMSRPRARIGVIAYCLLLHIWLLATIL